MRDLKKEPAKEELVSLQRLFQRMGSDQNLSRGPARLPMGMYYVRRPEISSWELRKKHLSV